jgi:hypothetical protein
MFQRFIEEEPLASNFRAPDMGERIYATGGAS